MSRRKRTPPSSTETGLVIESPLPPGPPPTPLSVCPTCRGPFFFCQGQHDGAVATGPVILALRAGYLACLLAKIPPLFLFSGTLFRFGHRSLRTVGLADKRAFPVTSVAAEKHLRDAAPFADPRLEAPGADLVALGGRVWELLQSFEAPTTQQQRISTRALAERVARELQSATAPWIVQASQTAHRAALDGPSKPGARAYEIVALLCARCAAGHPDNGLVAVQEYDHAVTCPSCGAEHVHPVWAFATPHRPHPVARCFGDATTGCLAHDKRPLLLGLCDEGRGIYERAAELMACVRGELTPWQARLHRALARATRRDADEQAHAEASAREDGVGQFLGAMGKLLFGVAPANPRRRRTRTLK